MPMNLFKLDHFWKNLVKFGRDFERSKSRREISIWAFWPQMDVLAVLAQNKFTQAMLLTINFDFIFRNFEILF